MRKKYEPISLCRIMCLDITNGIRILYSRLVRDLLGLDVILVFYPGHLATAVNFKTAVNGDYIDLNGRHFTVCDPTYIGAPIGMTMPDMDNKTAKIILLGK